MIADRIHEARVRRQLPVEAINFLSWFEKQYDRFSLESNSAINNTPSGIIRRKYFVSQLIQDESLASNAFANSNTILVFDDGEKYKINQGMRITKILAKFVEKYGSATIADQYEAFRIWHSTMLQNKYVDGTLCLSIHPLDFMTMSDNDNNWNSCMRWQDGGGDYRAGTVECMNSPYILVAYLHIPQHTMSWDNDHEWNSKQWRELFFINGDIMSEIYGYPFQDENLTNTVLMWIKELAATNLGLIYNSEEVNVAPDHVFTLPDDTTVDFDITPEWMMYNDIGRLSKHRARINIDKVINASTGDKKWPLLRHYVTSYGGRMTCMCCGRVVDHNQVEHNVFCDSCETVLTCACCNDVISEANAFYFVNRDVPYCEYCFNDTVEYDSLTEEPYCDEDITYIYWRLGMNSNGDDVYSDECIKIGNTHGYAYSHFARIQPKLDPDDMFGRYYLETQDFYSLDEATELFFNGASLSEVLADYEVI